MITSTFLPAVVPPWPPPLLLLDSPEVRPATTPTTPAMSAITATRDSENFTRALLSPMLSPPSSLARAHRLRERFLKFGDSTPTSATCQEKVRIHRQYALHCRLAPRTE